MVEIILAAPGEGLHLKLETIVFGNDFKHAYALASAGIKAQFDERLFAALIRRGYPALLRAGDADLGVVRDQDGEQAQVTVAVTDRQQRSMVYLFSLVKEDAGWRINGVVLEQKPPRGDI